MKQQTMCFVPFQRMYCEGGIFFSNFEDSCQRHLCLHSVLTNLTLSVYCHWVSEVKMLHALLYKVCRK